MQRILVVWNRQVTHLPSARISLILLIFSRYYQILTLEHYGG